MRVLIAAFDLFGIVGGGQTFYRNVIRRNPGVEFVYLRWHEPPGAAVPANARPVEFRGSHLPHEPLADLDPTVPIGAAVQCATACDVARAVAGESFDVVDQPDYYQFGGLLRPALRHFGVRAGRHFLSMHGAVSTAFELNWGSPGPNLDLRELEQVQYAAADGRYFISAAYRDEWRAASGLEAHLLDPLGFLDLPEPVPYRPATDRPVLRFIGRTEKQKGPHLFLNLLWWLPRDSFAHAEVVGPGAANAGGEPSGRIVEAMARRRGLPLKLLPPQGPGELAAGFGGRAVTAIPSVRDTLNFVALESLFAGCPAVIGSGAGVCRFLRERFPALPFTEFDVADFYGGVPRVAELLADYDARRAALREALRGLDVAPRGPALTDVYRAAPSFDQHARSLGERWFAAAGPLLAPALARQARLAA
jgi:glycosyltransferase involved in cell wall biosynthesis